MNGNELYFILFCVVVCEAAALGNTGSGLTLAVFRESRYSAGD